MIILYYTENLPKLLNIDFFLLKIVKKNILLRIVIDAIENEGQNLRENIDVWIQASTETLDYQHAENHAAKGSVLLDSMTDHCGE